MAGTQPGQNSIAAAAIMSGSGAAGAGGLVRPPAQVLSDLFDALATLMAEVNPADQDAHNAEIAKVKDQITQAKADLAAEDTRIATERAALDSQAYRIMLDQSASNEVLKRRHRSRLPLVYEARNLFNTPGAGTSNPPVVNRAEAPGAGAPVQPRLVDPPRQDNIVAPHVPTPPGHYSNPMDNIVAAEADPPNMAEPALLPPVPPSGLPQADY